MEESIHGHEVLHMMVAANRLFTKDSLEKAIMEAFGPQARFHTCSAQDMTARELIELLEGRGKFIKTSDGFYTTEDKICRH